MTYPIQIARQPIFEEDLTTIHAYELLSRPIKEDGIKEPEFTLFDGCAATKSLIRKTFLTLGLEHVSGGYPVFINFTHNLLLDPIHRLLPMDETRVIAVIEILEDIVICEELVNSVQGIVDEGYVVALDDFVYCNEMHDLCCIAEYIKLDVLALNEEELAEQVEVLERYNVKLLAEKVEDDKMIQFCKSLGFKYFQGYGLARPELVDEDR